MYRPTNSLLLPVTGWFGLRNLSKPNTWLRTITNSFLIAIVLLLLLSCREELRMDDPGNLVPVTVDQDDTLPKITVNGAQLHSEAFGNPDDPMVVVLHGGPGADYRSLLNCTELVSQGYRVVFFDQRGTGLSQRFPYSTYTLQLAYDDLTAVIAHYRSSPIQKVFLLGHSWGAMLATAYINLYPNAIDGAILCEPGGFKWQDVKDYGSRETNFSYLSETLNDAFFSDQFITATDNEQAVLDYKFDMLASTSASKDSPIGNEGSLSYWRGGAVTYRAFFDLGESIKPDWTTNLSQYTTKVLFIYSEHNKAYGQAHAEKVSGAYKNVQLFEARGAGHDMLSFSTGWKNSSAVIIPYLNSLK